MKKSVSLYGKMLAFSRLTLNCTLDELDDALKNRLEDSEKVVPVVLECEQVLPLEELIDKLWSHQVAVMGVVDGVLNEQAIARKLAIFPSDGKRIDHLQTKPEPESVQETKSETPPSKPVDLSEPTESPSQAPVQAEVQGLAETGSVLASPLAQKTDVATKIHRQMVRSGQSIHHIGGDLVITASVNHGAEVATDYNLHIYGKGQGRLVAGATGDENAHIFCQNFNPSLVSVAGTYCLKDDIPKEVIGKAVQVSFSKETGLVFTVIG